MPFDLRRIAQSQKVALTLVDSADRQHILEQFIESSGPLVEAAARDELQHLIDGLNAQLAPGARVRLIQEGSTVVPEIISLGEEPTRGRTRVMDSDSISKVLVRMPSEVKTKAADAAQKAGTSLNNWTVNVLERALVNLRDRQERAGQPPDQPGDRGSRPPPSTPQDETEGRNTQ